MATQYTPTLKLALPVTGELSGTWGDVVNDNITSMVEQAIAGLATINTWTANVHTLTVANGLTSESRCAMLVAADGAGGTALTAAGEIICPAASKLYVLRNGSSYGITLKTSAGTGIAVPTGQTAFLFCDGTNVLACVTTIVDGRVTGNLTVDGNATINGNTTLGNATSDTITATARFNTDLVPSTDNARDLGSAANSWKDLYVDGTIFGSTIDLTNLEVTNIKAKDGTAAATIADSTGVVTISQAPVMTALTASQAVFTTSGKALVSNAITGTGNVVMSASPTLTGTIGAAAATLSGNLTLSGGTANGVGYLNASKVLTTGSALTFDGSKLEIASSAEQLKLTSSGDFSSTGTGFLRFYDSVGAKGYLGYAGTASQMDLQTGAGMNFNLNATGGTATFSVSNSEQMRLTSTGLGIGTSSPAYKLDVTGTINSGASTATGYNLVFRTSGITTGRAQTALTNTSGDFYTGIEGSTAGQTLAGSAAYSAFAGTFTANPLYLVTSGSIRATLNASGNLGLGVTPSAWDASERAIQLPQGSIVGAYEYGITVSAGAYRASGGGWVYTQSAAPVSQYRQVNGAHSWFTAPSGTAGNPITFTQAMTLDASGRLLVNITGTLGFSEKLGVVGTIAQQGTQFNIVSGTSTPYEFVNRSSSAGFDFYVNAGSNLALRLNASGNLGLGVTASAWISSWKALDINSGGSSVYGSTAIGGLATNAYLDSGATWRYKISSFGATEYRQGSNGSHIWFTAPSGTAGNPITFTQVMTLDASGNLGVGNTAPTTAGATNYRNVVVGSTAVTNNGITIQSSTAGNGALAFNDTNGAIQGAVAYVHSGDYLEFASNSLTRLRLDNAGNAQTTTGAQVVWAPAPASISTTATLTNANIQGQIINTTGTSYTVTMPLGTTLETLVPWATTNLGYDFSVINTASGTITIASNTGVTTLGGLTIATGTSARFRIRRTAANTFILYRL